MSEFLLEIGCEEIPAAMLEPAANSLRDSVAAALKAAAVPFGAVSTYHTPRRLVLTIMDLAPKQPDQMETVIGPPKSVCYDQDGQFTKAARSFAERNNVPLKALTVTTTPRGEYMAVSKKTKGVKTSALLAARLPKAIAEIPFPKSMYWTEDRFRFARPIRWIVALLDGRVIPFSVAGVSASARTHGHRMLGRRNLSIAHVADYIDTLEKNFVVVDPVAREHSIRVGLKAATLQIQGTVRPDDELLGLVVNLNEYPTVISGHFDEAYLSLPKEVLVTVMRTHQKYFSVLDAQGEMRPYFLTVVNTDADPHGLIRTGHERVLRARLADAQFFWQTDRKQPIYDLNRLSELNKISTFAEWERESSDRLVKLSHILFQEQLGNYRQKTWRIRELSNQIVSSIRDIFKTEADYRCTAEYIRQAATLSKVDLTTEMVKEFTDLQGIMGGIYAREDGYPEQVWKAIYDHYQPKNLDESSPRTIEGQILSIADKLDTIVGCFLAGLVPSGTRDPFALRRQGNGIIKIMLDRGLKLSLEQLVNSTLSLPEFNNLRTSESRPELLNFFEGRLRYVLEMRGFRYDEINAVFAAGFDMPYEALQRAEALARMRPEEDFLALSTAFKRIKNILRDQPLDGEPVVRPELLSEEAERALYRSFETTRPQVDELVTQFDYYGALKRTAAMRQAVDLFFDKVLVMAPDADLRKNRIHLLHKLADLFKKVADISEIVVEKT